jgi:hypothetical protein
LKISKHQVDQEGLIHIPNCVSLLTMGIRKNVVTIWAVTDSAGKKGTPMTFIVKQDGDSATVDNCKDYITSFINDDGVWHLFGEPPENPIGKITPLPEGKIFT